MAYTIAGVLVLGLIGLVVALTSGGGDAAKTAPATATVGTAKAATTTKPPPDPPHEYPAMPPGKADEARRVAASFEDSARRANGLYDDSLKAKKAGNDALWQSKLKEAKGLYHDILDKWNDFIATLPSNKWYDAEQVVAHYFPHENGKVAEYTKKLANMKADER